MPTEQAPWATMSDTPAAPAGSGGPLAHIAEQLRPLAVPLAGLVLDPANARRHPERNMAAIRASLQRFGQRAPIVVQRRGNVVRAGNGRVEAMRALGWTHAAAVYVDDDNADAVAFAIADNRTAELAEWDDGALAKLIAELPRDTAVDLGFTDAELNAMLEAAGKTTPRGDDLPEPLPVAVSKVGDVWQLGPHRLACGDSTDAAVVAAAMAGERAALLCTDPPYNLGECWNGLQQMRGNRQVANDAKGEAWAPWMTAALRLWGDSALVENCAGYWWFTFMSNPRPLVESCGYRVHATIIWVKEHYNVGRGDYHSQFDPCLYFSRGKRYWCGRRDVSDVWDARRIEQIREHPNQKPVSLISRCIENSTSPTALVFDPFSGSGTTIIAAHQLGRRAVAIELAPHFADMGVRRWQTVTGGVATLGGKRFDEVAAERGVTLPAAG